MPRFTPRRPSIAVVQLKGVIGGGARLTSMVDVLQDTANDRSIRSLMLDIDSPGGSASASDAIRLAVARVRERKPVLAYVRHLGASGAYLVCCAATKVMAMPTSLVGSIGVISVRPQLTELMERTGIKLSVNKAGRLKDLGAFWREQTDEEQQVEQRLIDEYYDHFVDTIATARGLPRERVLEVATGEVFSGQRSAQLGLVDEVGDWEDARQLAARLGGLIEPRTVSRHPRRTLAEMVLGRGSGSTGLRTLVTSRVLYLDARSMGDDS